MSRRFESALVRFRILRGITQKDLAEALGVNEQTVSNWEVGRTEPKLSPKQYKALLRILQITSDQLPDDFGPQEITENVSPLTKLREQAGLTQAELARQLSIGGEAISEQTVRVWESGKRQPLLSITQVRALCRELGVSIDGLADYLESSQTEQTKQKDEV